MTTVTACAVHRITCEALKGPAPVYPNKPVIPQAYILPVAFPKVDNFSSSSFSVNRRISFGSWLCPYSTGRRRDNDNGNDKVKSEIEIGDVF
jgi:hypothetical protein